MSNLPEPGEEGFQEPNTKQDPTADFIQEPNTEVVQDVSEDPLQEPNTK
jgi:hypothetical protein